MRLIILTAFMLLSCNIKGTEVREELPKDCLIYGKTEMKYVQFMDTCMATKRGTYTRVLDQCTYRAKMYFCKDRLRTVRKVAGVWNEY